MSTMNAMVIGINPEYNYPGSIEKWKTNDTYYASNFGGSLITRSLMKIFNATYVSDFSDYNQLNSDYDLCILAFATHVTDWRDVSIFTKIIEKLDMPVLAPSLGVQDYSGSSTSVGSIHPSLKRLLEAITSKGMTIGTRGPYTASILMRSGIKNVIPIGCPTLYSNLKESIDIQKPDEFKSPIIVYQQNFSPSGVHLMEQTAVLGQDFLDEAVFTKNLETDTKLKALQSRVYSKFNEKERILKAIQTNGIFPENYANWRSTIGDHDFVVGTRLHGVICGLLQGIPSVLIPRDLRTQEIIRFYSLPTIPMQEISNLTFDEIYSRLDFSKFNSRFKIRYNNFIAYLQMNGITSKLSENNSPQPYEMILDDFNSWGDIFSDLPSKPFRKKSKITNYKKKAVRILKNKLKS